MGKIKGLLQDYQDYYGYSGDYIDESDLWEYQQICFQEDQIRMGKYCYQLDEIEEHYYNLYMEGKLCGEQTNTALTGSDTNSKDGQTVVGLRKRRNTQE